MACSRLSVPGSRYRERERRGGSGAGRERDNFFAVPVLFLFVLTKWKPQGWQFLRVSVRHFCFCSRHKPRSVFFPFWEWREKRGIQRLEEGVITGYPPPFKWWVICNPGVWGFTILDFWYIIFLIHYNEKVCGIAVLIIFHVDYFAVFCHIAVSG